MSTKLSEFIKTPKGQLIFSGGFMVIALTFFFVNMIAKSDSLFVDAEDIAQKVQELAEKNSKYSELKLKEAEIKKSEALYAETIASIPTTDVDIATELRNILETSATKNSIQVSSLGAVRTTVLTSDVTLYEVDISGTAVADSLANMLIAINLVTPKAEWRKLEIRVGGRMEEGSVSFTGTLGMMQYTGEKEATK